MAELRVGTSGWHYRHWREVFYPPDLKTGDWLGYYSGSFDTVEINNSFYRLPSRANFESWAQQVPSGFTFAVKASRFITHVKKLKEPHESISRLLENAEGLGGKLGPVLFQLPPRWKKNVSRLEEFLKTLPAQHRYVFEFRDETWLHDDVYALLEAANCALCIASSPSFPQSRQVTADFAFLRFHGGEDVYTSRYAYKDLKSWSTFATSLLQEGRDVYAYFNNDAFGYALENAKTFRGLILGG